MSKSALFTALSCALLACGGSTQPPIDGGVDGAMPDGAGDPSGTYFPPASGTWETIDPASAGFDPTKLAALNQFVQNSASTTFMILYDGRIVTEQYWNVTPTDLGDVESVQKSITSMLVGIAIDAGKITLDDTVTSVVGAGWSKATAVQEAAITVRNLLTMTTGLDSTGAYSAPAGTEWMYNTSVYHELHPVLQAATGQSLEDYTRSVLFDPIGVGTSGWSGTGELNQTMKMNPRDMSRVGLLMMTGGMWAQKQIVPADYLAQAFVTSQQLNLSYGLLFWLNGKASALLPAAKPFSGELVPSGPADMVMALGKADQKIYASPSRKLVVVRQGLTATSTTSDALSNWDESLWQQIEAAMQ